MITDKERREIARRLRESAGTAPYMNTADDFAREVFRAAMNEEIVDYRAAIDWLADLIEPAIPTDSGDAGLASVEEFIGEMRHSTKEEQDAYNTMLEKMSVEMHPVDREALLRLAKSLDAQAECRIKSNDIIARRGDRSRNTAIAKDFSGIAREIRNALGVGR